MSWIPESNKNIYKQAFNALCTDASEVGKKLYNTTSNLVISGYNTVKDKIDELDKEYNLSDSSDEEDSSNESEEYLDSNNLDDILIRLDVEKNYIKKVYRVSNGEIKCIKGKLSSYVDTNQIISKWFVYEKKDGRWKWYPTPNLYTTFRNNSDKLYSRDSIRILFPMNEICFKNIKGEYIPYPKEC